MSFILDALRKLEEKQARESTRDLLGPAKGPGKRGGRLRVFALAGGMCALAVAVAVWGWMTAADGEGPRPTRTAAVETAEKPPAPERGPDAPRSEGVPPAGTPATEEAGSALPSPGGDAPAVSAAEAEPEESDLPRALAAEDPPPRPADAAPAGEGAAVESPPLPLPDQERIFGYEELPEDLRAALGGMRITGHVYSSEPSLRRLNVDDGMWREGDSLPLGARILEITEEGAVFSLRGYRFSLRVSP